MIVKVLINTSVKTLNKVYDYNVPVELVTEIEIGKRVEVNFGKSRTDNEEGIIVKIVDDDAYVPKFKLKNVISVLDDISYIDENKLKFAKYISHVYFCNVFDAIKLMLPPGTKSKTNKKNINTKQDIALRLLKSETVINMDIENEMITSTKHIRLLKFLIENEVVLVNDVVEGLNISKAVIETVIKKGYIEKIKIDIDRNELDFGTVERTEKLEPTSEQKQAILKINSYIIDEVFKECLLFGVTGSGKTEVYLQVIESVLKQGRKVIVLVPEISLTYQTIIRFVARFGEKIAILHSKMTVASRKNTYKKIKFGEIDIVIGTRSAIFAPIDNIGLVIVDEEHDSSYYSQITPKYSTKEIARYICSEQDAVLLLGSATPEVSTYYRAKDGNIELISMTSRPEDATLPEIELVDMKEERLLGNYSILSSRLKEEIIKNIKSGEQTMILLNKRGYTSYLTCTECSHIFKCTNCDVALTHHKNNNLLLCHYCSYTEKNVHKCPKCNSERLSSGTIGIQKLEEELLEMYPEITVLRMDADTTVARDSHQKILDEFRNENINVLIGTQMISKGHDIENVTLVGILGVDSMLSINDYTATEKAFSNIYQASGRAGRGSKKGRVIIQTNDTENYILQAVVENNYDNFFESEIEYRKMFGYPPFNDILMFSFAGKIFSDVKSESEILYNILQKETTNLYKVFSPKSPYIQRVNNQYRINIIMKANVNSDFYKLMYSKLNEYEKSKKKKVTMTIAKNPLFVN